MANFGFFGEGSGSGENNLITAVAWEASSAHHSGAGFHFASAGSSVATVPELAEELLSRAGVPVIASRQKTSGFARGPGRG